MKKMRLLEQMRATFDKQVRRFNGVKTVLHQMKRNRAMRMFQKMMADRTSGLDQIVGRAAERRAWAMCMNWLDSKRIIHCRFCPNTEQLHRHGPDTLCDPHFQMVMAQPSTNGKESESATVR